MEECDLTLVLACYNESEIFEDSLARIIAVLEKTSYTWEIMFVDDCSQDNTRDLIEKAIADHSARALSALYHDENGGRGKTVVDGFRQARGKYVGYIDFDLETDEWYIPKFIDSLEKGADAANAWRIYDIQFSALDRWFASKGYNLLRNSLLKLPFHDTEAGYKFFKKESVLPLLDKAQHPGWFFDTEILALCHEHGLKIVEIPVVFLRRTDKTSTVRLIPDTIRYFVDLVKFTKIFRKRMSSRSHEK